MSENDERLQEFVHFVKFTSIVFGSSMSLFLFALALYHFGVFRRLLPGGGSRWTTVETTAPRTPEGDTLNTNPLLQADKGAEEPAVKTAYEKEEKTEEINHTQVESSGTQQDSSEEAKSQNTQMSAAQRKTMYTAVELQAPSDTEELHCLMTAVENSEKGRKKK